MARARLAEARLLLKAKRYSASFYLAGFAVECALKACIAKQTRRFEFPDKVAVNESYVHDLKKLVRRAGLEPELDRELRASRAFKENWAVVKDWANDSRYNATVGYPKARDMYQAITARRAAAKAER